MSLRRKFLRSFKPNRRGNAKNDIQNVSKAIIRAGGERVELAKAEIINQPTYASR